MVLVSASVDAYLFTAAAVALPIYIHLRQRNTGSRPDAPYEPYLTIFVGLHTLYIFYNLILCWPFNLFSRLHIPLNASPDTIRSTITRRAGLDLNAPLPRTLENLLTRLSSFEMRTLYVRFGQAVLQECEHCRTFDDYALFALPRMLSEYICEVAVIGLLTVRGTGRGRWRTYVVGALICGAVVEAYWTATAKIDMPTNGLDVFMWHDNLWALRQLAFLLTPLLTHFLLPATPYLPDPAAPALAASAALEQASARLATLRYTRGAVMRQPQMRAAAGEWWERQRVEGEWAREDEGVQRVAERLGKGFAEGSEERGEGKIRTIAREAVARLRAGLVSTESEGAAPVP